jgi:hypothetical protein
MEDVDKVYPVDLKILCLMDDCTPASIPKLSYEHFSILQGQGASVFQMLYMSAGESNEQDPQSSVHSLYLVHRLHTEHSDDSCGFPSGRLNR